MSNQKTTYAAVLGQVIVNKRKKLEISQGKMAELMGLSQASWSRIEKGLTVMNADQIYRAAGVLGTQASDLLIEVDKAVSALRAQGVEFVDSQDLKKEKGGVGVGTILAGAALAGFLLALMAKK